MPPRGRRKRSVLKTDATAAKAIEASMEMISNYGVYAQSDYLYATADCRTPLNSTYAIETQSTSQDASEDNNHGKKTLTESKNQDIKTNPVIARNVSKNKCNIKRSINSKTPHSPSEKTVSRSSLSIVDARETLSTSQHLKGINYGRGKKSKSDLHTSIKSRTRFSQPAVNPCRKYIIPEKQSLNLQDIFLKSNEPSLKLHEISEFKECGQLQTASFNVEKNYFEAKLSAMIDNLNNSILPFINTKTYKQYSSLLKCYKCQMEFLSQESMYYHYHYGCCVQVNKKTPQAKNPTKNETMKDPIKINASFDSIISNSDKYYAFRTNIPALSSSHPKSLQLLSGASENSSKRTLSLLNSERVAPVVNSKDHTLQEIPKGLSRDSNAENFIVVDLSRKSKDVVVTKKSTLGILKEAKYYQSSDSSELLRKLLRN